MKTKIIISLSLATAVLSGCRQKANGIAANSGSSVSSVDLRLPEKNKFSADPNVQSQLTNYQLEFAPTEVNSACSQGETRTDKFENTKLPDLKVKRGCGYRFKLTVGPSLGLGLTPWFSGETIADKATVETGVVAAKITLLPTPAAVTAGVPAGTPITPIFADTNVSITADVQGQLPGIGPTLLPPTAAGQLPSSTPGAAGAIWKYLHYPLSKLCTILRADGTEVSTADITMLPVADPKASEENCHTACSFMAGSANNCPQADLKSAYSYWYGTGSDSKPECVIRNKSGTIEKNPSEDANRSNYSCRFACLGFANITCFERPTREEMKSVIR